MLRLVAGLLVLLPGAALAQYYQQPYQPPPVQAWEPNAWQRNIPPQYRPQPICTTVYGRGAGGQVIASTRCQ